jgi:hypothetical protein
MEKKMNKKILFAPCAPGVRGGIDPFSTSLSFFLRRYWQPLSRLVVLVEW